MMHRARLWPSLQPWIVRFRGREHNSPDPVLGLCLSTSNRYINTRKNNETVRSYRIEFLLKYRISDNAGAVKHFLSVLFRALGRARHFALVEGSAIPTKARS